jgi:predicted ATPase/DNA-binding winged helix-turn-helix (wHTH) protein
VAAPAQGPIYTAGEWEIDLARRELRLCGAVVPIGARAFEIVGVLVQCEGGLITKQDLMGRIWPGAIVEENTLQVHVSAIRKALGPDKAMLKNVFGRGYRLLGDWRIRQLDVPEGITELPATSLPNRAVVTNLPVAAGDLIGRAAAAQQLRDLLSAYRAVTLTGPGGIGKTSLALEVARSLLPEITGAAWIVELASLSDPHSVPSVVAGVLGLPLGSEAMTPERIARAIRDNRNLLVIDNCEHVVDAAAELVEAVVRTCPNTMVLVTSREVLRIEGEYVYRVAPLNVPPENWRDEGDALGYSSVQLFVARMQALRSDFVPDDDDLGGICAICRHLDGIPLASELAAGRAAVIGANEVASRLDERFELLAGGRRTALPRHQTLLAMLDWSHDLLTANEQMTLRRLAVFAGGFALEAATGVVSDAGLPPEDVIDCISSLVAKSLVVVEQVTPGVQYRLLETTRAYAQRLLEARRERDVFCRRHAEYCLDLMRRAATEGGLVAGNLLSRRSRNLADEISAALEWTYSPRGDTLMGVALTLAAIPLWIGMSVVQECRRRVEQAIAGLHREGAGGGPGELQLLVTLATAMQNGAGPGRETTDLWHRANELAERLGDRDFQARTLWGLWIDCRNAGEHRQGLQVANRFHVLASLNNERDDMIVADRMVGMSLFILGYLRNAKRHIQRMLTNYVETSRTSHSVRFHFEQRAGGEFLLALIHWLQGRPQQARTRIDDGVAEVEKNGHVLQLCVLLAQFACPVAFLIGDLDRLGSFVSRLLVSAERHGLAAWSARGRCWQALLRIAAGEIIAGVPALDLALQDFPGQGRAFQHVWLLGELAKAQAAIGMNDDGLRSIERALEQADMGGEQWCAPELLRIRGIVLTSRALPTEAEAAFHQSLSLSRKQGARAWELRTATSLARLWCGSGRLGAAAALLGPICAGFDHDLLTDDIRDAQAALLATQ